MNPVSLLRSTCNGLSTILPSNSFALFYVNGLGLEAKESEGGVGLFDSELCR